MYTIDQLCAEFEEYRISRHTIEWWKKAGVLSHAFGGRGLLAYYTDLHIKQIRAILRAREHNVTLADLAQRHGNHPGGHAP